MLALALILWFILGYFYSTNSGNCECCTDDNTEKSAVSKAVGAATTTAAAVAAVKNTSGPLMYKWSDGSAITGDGWENRRKSILDGIKDNQKLEITGLYRSDETNSTEFENLGLARADAASKLFIPPLSADRIDLVGKLTTGEVNKDNPFVSASFRNLMNTSSIKETADKTIIRFPFNSTNKLNDRAVENYLTDVAERVKKSGERISLSGHTDAIASTESNLRLGQRRADIIKEYLMSKGVAANKIITATKGESEPIATNNTKAGRAENRRTELQIIK